MAVVKAGLQLEMANGLKNYATVSTAEPIATQLSYNIGTENIENGKDGETLNNTEMTLQESSIITEIENADLGIYDNKMQENVNNFDVDIFERDIYNKSPNVKIIDVQRFLPPTQPNAHDFEKDNMVGLDKQIYMPEALEMSLACEEETPSTWVDAMNIINREPVNIYEQSLLDEIPLTAVPTAIQSYINVLPQSKSIPDTFKTKQSENNILKNLTADADICRCVDCKCSPYNSCHGCNESENQTEQTKNISSQYSGCCSGKSDCCASVDKSKKSHKQSVDEKKDDCCVVVCLKSLDQLREMLSAASSCSRFNFGTLGCVKNNLCAIKK